MKRWENWGSAIFLLIYTLSAAVQYNDQDGLRWGLLYGAAAMLCGLYLSGRSYPAITAILSLIALGWGLWLLPQFLGTVDPKDIYASLGMRTEDVEEAREAGGALLVFSWTAVLSWMGFAQRSNG